jgi:thiol:disulfide interchange protein
MPFGLVYGALFFAVLGFWLIFASVFPASAPMAAARLFAAPAALALAVALAMRRSWARWTGVAMASLLAAVELWIAGLAESVSCYVMLFGSVTAAVLLALPATGKIEVSRPAPRLGTLLGLAVYVGIAGLLGSLYWAAYGPEASQDRVMHRMERLVWSDFGSGLERAGAEGKPMVIFFFASWCGYCKRMDRTTWKDPAVIETLSEKAIAVRIDGEETAERNGFIGNELAARFGVGTYPTIVLLSDGGREISRAVGFREPRELLEWLHEAAPAS